MTDFKNEKVLALVEVLETRLSKELEPRERSPHIYAALALLLGREMAKHVRRNALDPLETKLQQERAWPFCFKGITLIAGLIEIGFRMEHYHVSYKEADAMLEKHSPFHHKSPYNPITQSRK